MKTTLLLNTFAHLRIRGDHRDQCRRSRVIDHTGWAQTPQFRQCVQGDERTPSARAQAPLCGVSLKRLALLVLLAGASGASSAESITIDANAPTRPFPHVWEQTFGSGRANLSLRQSWRQDLKTVKQATGFQFVRFHAIFHDENGVYREDGQGHPIYNFSYVDQIYDGLLENGVRPFVELSFMPKDLAASQTPHAFWYKPLPAPPKDYAKWAGLIRAFAEHLVARYGIDEVSRWIFEVWNEPNIDFWTGDPKEPTYYQLYDAAAGALKQVSPRLRVGGPATAQAAWIDRFIDHCVKTKAPVDFVSTHVYANDSAEDVFGTHESINRHDMVGRSVRKVYEQVKHSSRPDLPIYWSEYNASYANEVNITDSAYMGPWLANNIRECDGLTAMMSYWSFSDVFEEQGILTTPFYGGFGLIAAGGIPKASFNAFVLLHKLGDRRIPLDSLSALATKRSDGSLAIAVWNYVEPGESGAPLVFHIRIDGLSGSYTARTRGVDPAHGSTLDAWRTMGSPAEPTREQQRALRLAAKLAPPMVRTLGGALTLTVPAHGLVLVEVSPK